MKIRIDTKDWLPRVLALLLLLLALMAHLVRVGAAGMPAAAKEGDAPLDLPAMTLTPADLEQAGLAGFGLAYVADHNSGWRTSGDVAYDSPAHQADGWGDLTLDQINVKLPRTGWLRQYRGILAIPDPADPSSVDRSVFSEVGEYADAAGADAALSLLTHGGEAEDAGGDSVGDRLEIRRDVLYRVGSRLTLTFRDGNLIGTIQIFRYATRDGAELGPALRLAHRLQERMAAGVAHPGPGLSGATLRLDTVASPPLEEQYLRLGGETFPHFGDSQADIAGRIATLRDSIDVYELSQTVEPNPGKQYGTELINRLYRFPDEAAVGSWLEALPQGLAEDAANSGGYLEVDRLTDAPPIGDESLTFAVTFHPEGATMHGYRIYARVGVYGVRLQFAADGDPPLALAEDLAIAQIDCIRAGSCAKAVHLPRDYEGLSCPPVSDSDLLPLVGAGPERGAVPMNGADPAHTGANPGPGPTGSPEEQWQFVAPGVGGRGPVAADGLIYVTSVTGAATTLGGHSNLYALDSTTGKQRWCVTAGKEVADPVVAGGLVFTEGGEVVGDHEQAFVVALMATTGVERWRFAIDPIIDSIFGGITVADGTVYAGTGMGALFALDAATGEARWMANLGANGDIDEIDYVTAPAVVDGVVYVADNQTLHALDASTGEELWHFRAEAEHELLRTPTVADGIVYVAGIHDLYAVDAQSGDEVWRFATEGPAGLGVAVVNGVVYLGTGSEASATDPASLYALNAESGEEIWQFDTDGYVSVPVVADGVVYVGTGVGGRGGKPDGAVHALAAETGNERWSYLVDGMPRSPIVLSGRLYVTTWTPNAYDDDQTLTAIGGTVAPTGDK
jgi:outer membrane protein assembly factor BamB